MKPAPATIDNRSFQHNDEINVALRDPQVAAHLLEHYEQDLIVGPFVWILERQQ